jgi:hypothetical protein
VLPLSSSSPSQRHRLRGRHVTASKFEFTVRGVTLSSLPRTVGIPHSRNTPFSLCWSDLTVISYSFGSYRPRITSAFYLSRDSYRLRARSHFVLESRARPPHLILVLEATLCSSFATPYRMARAFHFSRLYPVTEVLPKEALTQLPCAWSSLQTHQFSGSWLTAPFGMAQPHSFS